MVWKMKRVIDLTTYTYNVCIILVYMYSISIAMGSKDIRACRRPIDSSQSEALRRIKIYQLSGCDLTPRFHHLSYTVRWGLYQTEAPLSTQTRISLRLSRTPTGRNINVFWKRQGVLPSFCTVVHRSRVTLQQISHLLHKNAIKEGLLFSSNLS